MKSWEGGRMGGDVVEQFLKLKQKFQTRNYDSDVGMLMGGDVHYARRCVE